MIEPVPDEEGSVTLTLDSQIVDIDPKLAKRRSGSRSKEALEAHEVLDARSASRRSTTCSITTLAAATSIARAC